MYRRIVGRPDDWNDPDVWEYYLDDQEERNARLYDHGAAFYADLSILAQLWLTVLHNVRLSSLDPPSGAGAKQPGPRPFDSASTPELYPVKVSGNKTVMLRLEGRRTHYGYKSVEVLDEPLSTDVAILAALTVLEVSESPMPKLDRLISILREETGDPLGKTLYDHVQEMLAEHKEHQNLADRDVRFLKELDTRPFDYCLVLLRGRRVGFEDLTRREQLDLLKRTFSYIEPIASNARKLTKFLEYGSAEGLSTRTSESAHKQIAAALMKDAAGFTSVEIADELSISKPSDWDIKSDVPQARRLVDAGRGLLREALGTAGVDNLIRTCKAEVEWWRSLTDEQRSKQRQADWWVYDGWPENLVGGLGFSAGRGSDEAEDTEERL